MDTWGLIIAGVSIILYFASKKKPIFILTTGIGIGIVIAAVWSYYTIMHALDSFTY
jgi:lipid-A-disaccharide synthase-like uncharacterized protein